MANITAEHLLTRMLVKDPDNYGTLVSISSLQNSAIADVQDLVEKARTTAKRLALLIATSPTPEIAGITDMQRISMVYFRSFYAGLKDKPVGRVLQIPKYVTEVKPFVPLSPDSIANRQLMAEKLGLLALGPDECMAVSVVFPDDANFHVYAYENSDRGFCIEEACFNHLSIDYRSQPITVADLNVTQAKQHLETAQGAYYWREKMNSDLQNERLLRTIELLEQHIPSAPQERNQNGSTVVRSFIAEGNTESTIHLRPHATGWVKYPTSQDAWYFGVWINPVLRSTLTYAEQDVTHVMCETDAQFACELKDMANFHGRSLTPCSYAYGSDGSSLGFDSLTLLKGVTKTVIFEGTASIDPVTLSNSQAPFMAELSEDVLEMMAGPCDGDEAQYQLERYRQFDLNLLDPRSFDGPVMAFAFYKIGFGWGLSVRVGTNTYKTYVKARKAVAEQAHA